IATLLLLVAATVPSRRATQPSASSASRVPVVSPRYLLVIDFLAYAGEAVATDPIAGSPDAEDLIPVLGDPTAFGAEVTDQAGADVDANSRCGVIEQAQIEA